MLLCLPKKGHRSQAPGVISGFWKGLNSQVALGVELRIPAQEMLSWMWVGLRCLRAMTPSLHLSTFDLEICHCPLNTIFLAMPNAQQVPHQMSAGAVSG